MNAIVIISFCIFAQFIAAEEYNKNILFKVYANSTDDTSKIYITGNQEKLGNWVPDKIQLSNQKNHTWIINLYFPIGTELEYKFTRGSWNTEALVQNGGVRANYYLHVEKDTIIEYNINTWKDDYLKYNKRKITGLFELHHKVTFPGLKARDVIVWLPPGYATDKSKRYPVLYMHDGQNLFDPTTSFQGIDWQVDETADMLIKNQEISPIIIVGIYNTTNRRDEYSNTPLGKKYADFLINKLKPFIDKKYRTLSDRENTATCGSSMGGLISFILAWEHSEIFSKAICMSPAFKIDKVDYGKKVEQYSGLKKDIKIYIYNGGLDLDKKLQPGIDKMTHALIEKGYIPGTDFIKFIDEKAPHNESAWAKHFEQPLKFFYK